MQVTETEEAAWRLNIGNVCSRPLFLHCNALFIDIGAWRREIFRIACKGTPDLGGLGASLQELYKWRL